MKKCNNRVVVASSSRLRRRLLYLNRNPDDRINSISNTVKSYTDKAPFLKTGLMYVKRNSECNSNNCCETKISERENNNTNSTHPTHSIEATQKQHNCNVNAANNFIPHIHENYPKDNTECNSATDNKSRTDQVNTIAPIEQVNNIGPHSSVCNSHEVKLPDIRPACGDGQVNLPCRELDCIDEPEPLLCTQDLVLESTQNSNGLSEIQWDCQSLELVRDVKQSQGHYGIEEIRKVVANFSDTDVELQKPIVPELMLYSPVKSNGVLTRARQKAKVRAGVRLQRKAYGRESAEAILQWLQNKAAEQLPGGLLEKTAALETLESQQVCSYMTPSVSPVHVDDLIGNIPDDAFQIPLEDDDESSTCQSNSITTPVAAVSSVAYTQVLDLSKENTAVLKTLDTYQIQTVNISDGIFEKLQEVDEVLGDQASTVSTSASKPTSFMEAALNSLHVQADVTPSVFATEDDPFNVSFSDDDCQMLLDIDQALDSQASTVSTSAYVPPKTTASMKAALNSLHVQADVTPSVSATEDDAFDVIIFDDDDFHQLLEVDKALDSQTHTVSTSKSVAFETLKTQQEQSGLILYVSASCDDFSVRISDECHMLLETAAPSKKAASTEATLNSLHVQSAVTPSVSATEDNAFFDSFCGDQLLDTLDSQNSTSVSAPPKTAGAEEVAFNSLHVQSAMTSNVSATEDDDFDVSFSDDDDFHQLFEFDETLDSQVSTISTSKSMAGETLKSRKAQSDIFLGVSASWDDFNVSISDNELAMLLDDDDESLSYQAGSILTSKAGLSKETATVVAKLNPLDVQSHMTASVSTAEDNDFNVSIPDDDWLLEVGETLDRQANSISSSKTGLPEKTTAVVAKLNPLDVQSHMTASVSTTEDNDFSVSIPDDDWLLEVGETLDRQANSISDNELPMLLDNDETLDRQANSISSSKTTLPEKTAAVCSTTHQVLSDVIENVSREPDDDYDVTDSQLLWEVNDTLDRQANSISSSKTRLPEKTAAVCSTTHQVLSDVIENVSRVPDDDYGVSDSQLLWEVNEILDNHANILSTSAANSLHEKTMAVETSFKTLRKQSDMIQSISVTPDEDANIPDDYFEQMLEVDEALGSQTNILSASTAPDLPEKTGKVETLETLQIQSDMRQSFSMTQEFYNIPDDDFEQMLGVDEALGSQTNIPSTSTLEDLHEKTAEVGTLETLQVQSDLIQSISVTPDEDANFSDDDFQYLLGVNDTLGSQTNILSTSTLEDLHEKTAEVGTLETLQVQSDLIQSVSVTPDEDANFPEDDLEYLLEVRETLDSQVNILSTTAAVGSGVTHRPASGLHSEITSACKIFDTGQIQRPIFDTGQIQRPIFDTGQIQIPIFDTGQIQRPIFDTGQIQRPIFDTGQIQRPSTSNNDDVTKKLLEADETLHNQAGSISTSVTPCPGVAFTPVSDQLKTSLSETSPKTSQIQSSVNMNISKLANITDVDTNHAVFTSVSKQLSLSKIMESLSSSRAVNNSPDNVNSPRRFRFKRIASLQMSSYPYVSMHRSFLPHFSRMCRSGKWSNSSSLSSNGVMLNPVETSKCSQVRCCLEEIEQKRQAALLKCSLRLGQL